MEQSTPVDEAWADLIPAPETDTKSELNLLPRLQAAAACYHRRKNRREHPQGDFDKQSRFYPSEEERQSCCRHIRSPSAKYPYSLMVHCRTVEHVARLYGVTPEALRDHLRPPKLPKVQNPHRRLRGPTVWDKLTAEEPSSGASSETST